VPTFVIALGLSLLGGLGGLLIASAVLLLNDQHRSMIVPWLVSYAVGALLGIAMLGLLPDSLRQLPADNVFATLLAGVMLFFTIEKVVLWRHCHTHDCEVHGGTVASVVIGDAFHNFVDGAVIGAATVTSVPLGISTAIAVAAHEIPHEIGDFAIMLHAGYSRGRALLLNGLSALANILGAMGAVAAFDVLPRTLPYALSIAAASFLYIAMADLMPGLHRGRTDAKSLLHVLAITLGIATMAFFKG
jgi:zinc and cadmium transporter